MFTRPKDKTILSFFWLPYSGLGKAVAGIYPGSAMQWDALAFLPHPTDTPGSVAAGSDGCLLGRIHFPCGYVVYVLLCCWDVFPVLTLYSPRSIVWGLFFSPHFPHVNTVFFFNSTCISLLIILVWLCMWRIIKNLEPWTLNIQSPLRSGSPQSLLRSGSPQNPLRSWIPQSLLHSGSPQSPLNKPLLSSGGYLLHPGGILLCWHRPGLLLTIWGLCHGPAGVPWPATRCLCMLSSWLVVCCWCHVLSCLLSVPVKKFLLLETICWTQF